jgi:hypothetical protein
MKLLYGFIFIILGSISMGFGVLYTQVYDNQILGYFLYGLFGVMWFIAFTFVGADNREYDKMHKVDKYDISGRLERKVEGDES